MHSTSCGTTSASPTSTRPRSPTRFAAWGTPRGYERLWQIHLSCLYTNGNAAEVFGERFVRQDVLHRAFDVPGARLGIPDSDGDWIVDAYLDGLNAYVASLSEPPPEFAGIGATPRLFTRSDIAARYRFSSWFQARSWPEKMFLGRIMARHGSSGSGTMRPCSAMPTPRRFGRSPSRWT